MCDVVCYDVSDGECNDGVSVMLYVMMLVMVSVMMV